MVIVLAHIRSLVEVRRPDRVSKKFRMLMLMLLAITCEQAKHDQSTSAQAVAEEDAASTSEYPDGSGVQGSKGPRVRDGIISDTRGSSLSLLCAAIALAAASLSHQSHTQPTHRRRCSRCLARHRAPLNPMQQPPTPSRPPSRSSCVWRRPSTCTPSSSFRATSTTSSLPRPCH